MTSNQSIKKAHHLMFILLLVTIVCTASSIFAEVPDGDTADSLMTNSQDTAGVTATVEEVQSDMTSSIYPMDEERKENLIAYSSFNNIWRFVSFFIGLGIMALILFSGFSARMRDWASIGRKKFFVLWLYGLMFLVVDFVLNLPFDIYRGFMIESQYGFMNQTFGDWFSEKMLTLAIAAVFIIIPLWFLYWLINQTKKWWAWFAVGSIPFLVLMIVLVPVFLAPLFNDFVPVQNEEVRTEVAALASHAGIEGADIFQVNGSKQSTKINAYVTGLFGTKRIVLYDTMIDNFTVEEIKFVMGHEMGHYLMNHMWYGLGVGILFICFALWLTNLTIHRVISKFSRKFGFDSLGDYASLPLIMIFLSVISFVFQPINNSASRYMEVQADRFGMDISGVSNLAAATAFDKLSVFNLSDPDPSELAEFWFYSHPALKKRIEFVSNYPSTK